MNFSVGDRVRYYGTISGGAPDSDTGKVYQVHEDGKLRLSLDGGMRLSAWPQQCRRLAKRERRAIKASYTMADGFHVEMRSGPDWEPGEAYDFIEVRRKK